MPGTFTAGEIKTRPGIYFRVIKAGDGAAVGVPQGTVAALFRCNWGPLGLGAEMTTDAQVIAAYGGGANTEVPLEALKGLAKKVLPFRIGTGGTKGSYTIQDTLAANAVVIEALYVGARTIKISTRDSLTDATKRELLVYDGDILKETIPFTKGVAGDGEPAALVAAIATYGSQWITATKTADGSKLLATITLQSLAGGADPIVDGAAYSDVLAAIEPKQWNVLAIDSEDTAIHATVQAYIDRVNSEGKRVCAVLGEATAIALGTRLADAKAFNDFLIGYVANGVQLADGTKLEGYKAAARVAGMLAACPLTDSLTNKPVSGAVDIVGALTNAEIEEAINSGALVFTFNAAGQVVIEYGISTYITPDADHDDGWKKLRRVATRHNLMDRIAAKWATIRVNNSPDGRAILIQAAQGIINSMIAEGALLNGTIIVDPNNPPAGDNAYFAFKDLVDLDGAEKLYGTFAFQFGGQ